MLETSRRGKGLTQASDLVGFYGRQMLVMINPGWMANALRPFGPSLRASLTENRMFAVFDWAYAPHLWYALPSCWMRV